MRILKILLYIGISSAFLYIAFIKREAIVDFIKRIPSFRLERQWNPDVEYIEKYSKYKPELLLEQNAEKSIENGRNKFGLVKELEVKNGENYLSPLDIDVDIFGYVYLLDGGHQRIRIFDDKGNFIRSIGVRNGLPTDIVDISINSENVIIACNKQEQRIYLFNDLGVFLKSFFIPFEPIEVKADRDDFFILGIYEHFLVHRYSSQGVRVKAFCQILMKKESFYLKKIFNEGYFDVDSKGNVFVSYKYPYKIIKLDTEGFPIIAFNRIIKDFKTYQETIENKNREKWAISLAISVDSDGYVYNLIKNVNSDEGDRIDIYNNEGRYINTYHLEEPVYDFVVYDNSVIWCLKGDNNSKLMKYRIKKTEYLDDRY